MFVPWLGTSEERSYIADFLRCESYIANLTVFVSYSYSIYS